MADKNIHISESLKELHDKLRLVELDLENEEIELSRLKAMTSELTAKKTTSVLRLSYLQRHSIILQNDADASVAEEELKDRLRRKLEELESVEVRLKFNEVYRRWIDTEKGERERQIKEFVEEYDVESEMLKQRFEPSSDKSRQTESLFSAAPTSELSKDIYNLKKQIFAAEMKLNELTNQDEISFGSIKNDQKLLENITKEVQVYKERNKAFECSIQQKLGRIKTEYAIISEKMFALEMELSQK